MRGLYRRGRRDRREGDNGSGYEESDGYGAEEAGAATFYYFRVMEELSFRQMQFKIVAILLLLEAGALALANRRAGAVPFVRMLVPVTVGWAIAALALAAYIWWQLRVLSPHIPFRRLADGSIQYDRPLVVDVVQIGAEILMVGAVILLTIGVALLLATAWRSRSPQRTA